MKGRARERENHKARVADVLEEWTDFEGKEQFRELDRFRACGGMTFAEEVDREF